MPSLKNDLIIWLKVDEDRSRNDRAGRLNELVIITEDMPEQLVFYGGDVSMQKFEELRISFIQGLYISVVLLALSFMAIIS